jgi:2-keto-4-pentenoate hydratase/2-oxohepta-3-ene-1,7-dioic acid hydratase in catechol pathway
MRYLTFAKSGATAVGVRTGDQVVDLSIAAPELPSTLEGILALGDLGSQVVTRAIKAAPKIAYTSLQGLSYLPPILRPGKIICVGLNYADHAAESPYKKAPDYPAFFARYANSLVAHGAGLVRPHVSHEFDYEGELVAVIGRRGRYVPRDKALDLVAGYSVFNDASIRDYQFKSTQWLTGKDFDGTGAFGPEIVTANELSRGATGLRLTTRLNGEVVQSANTSDMIFPVDQLISLISEVMTLEPGDLIVAGTPAGVGFARKPQLWLKPGDVCEVEIEGVGLLRNPVVEEQKHIAEAATSIPAKH